MVVDGGRHLPSAIPAMLLGQIKEVHYNIDKYMTSFFIFESSKDRNQLINLYSHTHINLFCCKWRLTNAHDCQYI